jgi:adenylylsulfate kinase
MRNKTRRLTMSPKEFTVWFTGLPCAGKTTLARLMADEIGGRGLPLERLDGDVIHPSLSKGFGFSKEDRDENMRMG